MEPIVHLMLVVNTDIVTVQQKHKILVRMHLKHTDHAINDSSPTKLSLQSLYIQKKGK